MKTLSSLRLSFIEIETLSRLPEASMRTLLLLLDHYSRHPESVDTPVDYTGCDLIVRELAERFRSDMIRRRNAARRREMKKAAAESETRRNDKPAADVMPSARPAAASSQGALNHSGKSDSGQWPASKRSDAPKEKYVDPNLIPIDGIFQPRMLSHPLPGESR